jgi:ABC-2 type transport system permease protein
VRLLLHQLRGEQRLFWRSRESAVFTFGLPVVLFLLLGAVYGSKRLEGFKGSSYLLAGMIGYGVVATAFAGLAITLVIRRESGVLKRLRATPLPAHVYIGSVLLSTLLVFAAEVVVLTVLGRLLFGVPWPHRIGSLVLVILLGTLSFAALGVALTAIVRSAEGSSAVVSAIYLPMVFISGAFFSTHSISVLKTVAAVLPLTYYIRLVRDVMLSGREIWDLPTEIGVVAAWGVAGLLLAVRSFRWEPRDA